MSIYTPRGLKVRLDPVLAFAYLARLQPSVHPLEVFRTTEAIEHAPGLAGVIAAALYVGFGGTATEVYFATVIASCVVAGLFRKGLFVLPVLLNFTRALVPILGWGLPTGAVAIWGWHRGGWGLSAAFIGGLFTAMILNMTLEASAGKKYLESLGYAFTGAEISFFSAFRLHAHRIGTSTDLTLTDAELNRGHDALTHFALSHPDVTSRFSRD